MHNYLNVTYVSDNFVPWHKRLDSLYLNRTLQGKNVTPFNRPFLVCSLVFFESLSWMLHGFVFGFVKKLCTVVFKPRCNHCLEKLVKLHIGVPLCCTALLRLLEPELLNFTEAFILSLCPLLDLSSAVEVWEVLEVWPCRHGVGLLDGFDLHTSLKTSETLWSHILDDI